MTHGVAAILFLTRQIYEWGVLVVVEWKEPKLLNYIQNSV
jgi:hypothetical protein